MAELTPRERLQPCLLDRLTDDEPGKQAESRDQRVFSLRQVREAVLRDLSWLLNTPARGADMLGEGSEHVATSVLNYGVPDLCGVTSSGLSLPELERALTRAIRAFEPRIVASTLRVKAIVDESQMGQNALVFEITGDLWADPIPDPLYLRTSVDLETGQSALSEWTPR